MWGKNAKKFRSKNTSISRAILFKSSLLARKTDEFRYSRSDVSSLEIANEMLLNTLNQYIDINIAVENLSKKEKDLLFMDIEHLTKKQQQDLEEKKQEIEQITLLIQFINTKT